MTLLFLGFYLYFYTSFSLSINKDVETNVSIEGKSIKLDGEEFHLKAINFSSFAPGYDNGLDEDTYKRWFKAIQEMNINTIRVSSIEEVAFYEAFYNYNENNKNPLYLIQGIDIRDYSKNSSVDYFDEKLKEKLIDNVKLMIDVVHGGRIINDDAEYPSGNFFSDVSEWTIGYIIGTEWNAVTVKYTNELEEGDTSYRGDYVETTKEATPFERILAEVGDELFDYESRKYASQRLVSFGNTAETDPFTYETSVSDYFNKYVTIDVGNLETTSNVKSGMFASFQAYSYYPDYYSMSSQKYEDTYYEYLKSLQEHYEMPVIVTDFGFSTARGASMTGINEVYAKSAYTEEEQGEMIVHAIDAMDRAGINGFIINEWQDDWSKNIWSTMHSVDTTRSEYWHDVETATQSFGILAFEPGEKEVLVTLDENTDEWKKSDVVFDSDEYNLSLKYDQKYIYMLVQGSGVHFEEDILYIPIDLTPNSGSKVCESESLIFDRSADFLIKIDGKDNSKVLVQERYNTLNAIYGNKVFGYDQYDKDNMPLKNSSKFEDIQVLIDTQKLYYKGDKGFDLDGMSEAERHHYDQLGYRIVNEVSLENVGDLTYGTSDVESDEYNSLSDFYSSEDYIELRIPWQILNFSDPSMRMIHDDYYENYGVEDIEIDKMYVGVGDSSETIDFSEVELEGWDETFSYHERLKKSYYVIQDALKGGE